MNKIFFCLFAFFGVNAVASQAIKLNSIGYGKLLHIDGNVQLPAGQKLNQYAPSKIAVYEKEGTEWILTETVDLKNFFTLTELIAFQKPVKLRSEKSEIKLKASLYHCPRVGRGMCVIDDYEGIVNRDKSKVGSEVSLRLKGSNPS